MNTIENPSPWLAELIFKPGVHFTSVDQPDTPALICFSCLVDFDNGACVDCGFHFEGNAPNSLI